VVLRNFGLDSQLQFTGDNLSASPRDPGIHRIVQFNNEIEKAMTSSVDQTAMPETDDASWRDHLLEAPSQIRDLLERSHRIAVLGMKPDPDQPAYYVPEYAEHAGYEIIPVPVYYKELTEMMGKKVYRKMIDVPGEIDIVDVFRRPNDIPPHVDDIIAKKPKAVWFQLGIRNDAAAERLARAGIDVVQDHCLLVELRRIGR
jgi:predicted CoA-binding protein